MTFAARDQAERWWFECQGYVTLPGVMDAAWVAAALACVTRHRDEDGDGAAALGRHSRSAIDLCHHPRFAATLCHHSLPPLFARALYSPHCHRPSSIAVPCARDAGQGDSRG